MGRIMWSTGPSLQILLFIHHFLPLCLIEKCVRKSLLDEKIAFVKLSNHRMPRDILSKKLLDRMHNKHGSRFVCSVDAKWPYLEPCQRKNNNIPLSSCMNIHIIVSLQGNNCIFIDFFTILTVYNNSYGPYFVRVQHGNH